MYVRQPHLRSSILLGLEKELIEMVECVECKHLMEEYSIENLVPNFGKRENFILRVFLIDEPQRI